MSLAHDGVRNGYPPAIASPPSWEDMPINATWHRAHPMPKNPTLDERIRWHEDHSVQCGCRPIPEGLKKEITKRARAGR